MVSFKTGSIFLAAIILVVGTAGCNSRKGSAIPEHSLIAVFNDGTWQFLSVGLSQTTPPAISFGQPGDIPVAGVWGPAHRLDIGVFRDGVWILDFTGTGSYEAAKRYMFGLKGDIPIVGDWDDSGRNRIGVFRNGNWMLDWDGDHQWNPAHDRIYQFGLAGDLPVVGDWGDKKTGIGVFRGDRFVLDINHNFKWDAADKIISTPGGYPVTAAMRTER